MKKNSLLITILNFTFSFQFSFLFLFFTFSCKEKISLSPEVDFEYVERGFKQTIFERISLDYNGRLLINGVTSNENGEVFYASYEKGIGVSNIDIGRFDESYAWLFGGDFTSKWNYPAIITIKNTIPLKFNQNIDGSSLFFGGNVDKLNNLPKGSVFIIDSKGNFLNQKEFSKPIFIPTLSQKIGNTNSSVKFVIAGYTLTDFTVYLGVGTLPKITQALMEIEVDLNNIVTINKIKLIEINQIGTINSLQVYNNRISIFCESISNLKLINLDLNLNVILIKDLVDYNKSITNSSTTTYVDGSNTAVSPKGYFVGGWRRNDKNALIQPFLAIYDTNGNLLSEKVIEIGFESFITCLKLYNNEIIISGHNDSDLTKSFIVKLSDDGKLIMKEIIGKDGYSQGIRSFDIFNNELYAVGFSKKNESVKGWIVKYKLN